MIVQVREQSIHIDERRRLGRFVVEPGTIDVYADDSSAGGRSASFDVTNR
ncbi:hypothetical protein NE236_38135 [Actinoallomurus purpureus]|nr:hypothetical protein [Actinoallomurus purpureus]MCO6010796.1 hypothetical protein [Actinoallomurus purpureus]